MVDEGGGLLELARERFGGSLQSAAAFDEDGWVPLFFRPDIEALYSEDELDLVFEQLVLEGLGTAYLEDLFYAGELGCTVWVLDESVMFLFLRTDYSGAFVTVDPDTDADVLAFVHEARSLIRD